MYSLYIRYILYSVVVLVVVSFFAVLRSSVITSMALKTDNRTVLSLPSHHSSNKAILRAATGIRPSDDLNHNFLTLPVRSYQPLLQIR